MKPFCTAIIIPAFNKSYLTSLCIDSIFRAKTEVQFKIIIIDNSSDEEEALRLKTLIDFIVETSPNSIQLIRNSENVGFAKAVNQGLEISFANEDITHICILNNDTIVTDYWLDDLTSYSTKSFVGPVCNSVGNEQIIKTDYQTHGFDGYSTKSVNNFAKQWRVNHIGNVEKTSMLGFFCVLGETQLFKDVGMLDESFGLGYYEDDDYCIRVQKKGYDQKIVRQCFIHHWGSASFKELSSLALHKLFSKNRQKFIDKHKHPPMDHSQSWLTTILHEYDWLKSQNKNTQEVYNWIPPIGYGPLKYEVLRKLEIKTSLLVKPVALQKLLIFFLRAIQRRNLIEDIQKFYRKAFRKLTGKFFRFPMWKLLISTWKTKTIVVFPIQTFSGRMQRPQQLAMELAKSGYNVLWINPDPNKSKSSFLDIHRICKNLYIFDIDGLSYSNFYTSSMSTKDASRVVSSVKKLLSGASVSNCTALIQSPFWHSIDTSQFSQTVYDCMDAHDAFGSATLEVTAIEKQVIEQSKKITVSSTYLHNKITKDFNRDSRVVRNACNPADFKATKMIRPALNPTVGYFGAIAEWFDTDLLIQTAQILSNHNFVVIGNTTHSGLDKKKIPSNIKLLGEIPYSDLVKYAATWDVAIIPFLLTDLIKATNPVKMYEYFALGLPVVSTEIPEVIECPISVSTAKTASEFAEKIKLEITEDSESKRRSRQEFASEQTWNSRAKLLIDYLEKDL